MQVRALADKYGLKVYMDGARLMNAVVALDVEPREIVQHVDMLTMCFTKASTLKIRELHYSIAF